MKQNSLEKKKCSQIEVVEKCGLWDQKSNNRLNSKYMTID